MIKWPPCQPSACSNCVRPQSVQEHFGHALGEAWLLAADRLADEGDGREDFSSRNIFARVLAVYRSGEERLERRLEPVQEMLRRSSAACRRPQQSHGNVRSPVAPVSFPGLQAVTSRLNQEGSSRRRIGLRCRQYRGVSCSGGLGGEFVDDVRQRLFVADVSCEDDERDAAGGTVGWFPQ